MVDLFAEDITQPGKKLLKERQIAVVSNKFYLPQELQR